MPEVSESVDANTQQVNQHTTAEEDLPRCHDMEAAREADEDADDHSAAR